MLRTHLIPAELAQALDLKKRLQVHRDPAHRIQHCLYVVREVEMQNRAAAITTRIQGTLQK